MQALWLAAGCEPMQIALRDDQVSVQAGVLPGHYHTYEDKEKGSKAPHDSLVYGPKIRVGLRRSDAVPYEARD